MTGTRISHIAALFAVFVLEGIVPGAMAAPAQAAGIAVVNNGSTNRAYSPAYEYTSLRFGKGSFGLTLVGGTKVAGLGNHLLANYEYSTPPSVAAVAKMEALSRDHVKAAPYLAPRIALMKEELRKMELEAFIAAEPARKTPAILLAEMTVKGRAFRNVRATSLEVGKLRFIHDEGVFSLAADQLSESFLAKVGTSSAEISATQDFRDLMATFVNSLSIGGNSYTGARVSAREGEKLSIATDQGIQSVESTAIDPADLAKLEAAQQRFAKLTGKFKAAQEKEARKQAEYFARVEQEELKRYRMEQKAIVEAEGIAEGEMQIVEEFRRQKEAREKAASDAESALLLEMGSILGGDDASDGGSAAPETTGEPVD